MVEIDQLTPPLEITEEHKKALDQQVTEEMIELNYVDPLYGSNANLQYEYWTEL